MPEPTPKPYLTVRGSGVHELEIKKSRFICHLARVTDEAEAQTFIAGIRKQYWDARHNCTAFVVGGEQPRERSSDDGEPGGTAGVPMLEVLRRRGLTDTAAVVTRYFGGIKLGAGGLVRAYGSAVSEAVDAVGLLERRPVALLTVAVDHTRAGRLDNDLRAAGYVVRELSYQAAGVRIEVGVPEPEVTEFHAWLAEATGGSAVAEATGRDFVEVPVGDA
ncbi:MULTISPECIES: YigZ family protein [unclassified Kitasatospora]|uniref:YigZ family protein n=1 Tax=unclassified Kitasatospora TaxID=2633591 RepID=UPI00070ED103|nr:MULTISPECIES: YigZ family protein [unclassified Kitasatospora]KQV16119.1 IMPACT family protein [Kitasatospora sp. Root107]KRB69659.1 IMPACT family protein [Kitasatospora sp. Root187]